MSSSASSGVQRKPDEFKMARFVVPEEDLIQVEKSKDTLKRALANQERSEKMKVLV